jgi:hypothetical protein
VWPSLKPNALVSEPGFAAETTGLPERTGPMREVSDYQTLLADRAEPPDPEPSGHPAQRGCRLGQISLTAARGSRHI